MKVEKTTVNNSESHINWFMTKLSFQVMNIPHSQRLDRVSLVALAVLELTEVHLPLGLKACATPTSLFILIFMCMMFCLCTREARRRLQIPWNWSLQTLGSCHWVLRTKSKSFETSAREFLTTEQSLTAPHIVF